MWIFKRNSGKSKAKPVGQACPHCKSLLIRTVASDLNERPDYVRTWRGQRYLTCKCDNCGQGFYVDIPQDRAVDAVPGDEIVEDQEALQAAEEELKRQADEEDDRTFH